MSSSSTTATVTSALRSCGLPCPSNRIIEPHSYGKILFDFIWFHLISFDFIWIHWNSFESQVCYVCGIELEAIPIKMCCAAVISDKLLKYYLLAVWNDILLIRIENLDGRFNWWWNLIAGEERQCCMDDVVACAAGRWHWPFRYGRVSV